MVHYIFSHLLSVAHCDLWNGRCGALTAATAQNSTTPWIVKDARAHSTGSSGTASTRAGALKFMRNQARECKEWLEALHSMFLAHSLARPCSVEPRPTEHDKCQQCREPTMVLYLRDRSPLCTRHVLVEGDPGARNYPTDCRDKSRRCFISISCPRSRRMS